MRKCLFFLIAAFFAFSLAGCNTSPPPGSGENSRPIAAYIDDDVTSIEAFHALMGMCATWDVESEELDALRDWANNLKYELVHFEEGNTPGDSDGGEVYSFTIEQGDYPGFSYIIHGVDKCYLRVEDEWYSVSNPTTPPISAPQYYENGMTNSFSFDEVELVQQSGNPGVNPYAFKNTESAAVDDREAAIERAKNEVTIEYNFISVAYDNDAEIWCVSFSTQGSVGGDQSVYLDNNGITRLIVYGE